MKIDPVVLVKHRQSQSFGQCAIRRHGEHRGVNRVITFRRPICSEGTRALAQDDLRLNPVSRHLTPTASCLEHRRHREPDAQCHNHGHNANQGSSRTPRPRPAFPSCAPQPQRGPPFRTGREPYPQPAEHRRREPQRQLAGRHNRHPPEAQRGAHRRGTEYRAERDRRDEDQRRCRRTPRRAQRERRHAEGGGNEHHEGGHQHGLVGADRQGQGEELLPAEHDGGDSVEFCPQQPIWEGVERTRHGGWHHRQRECDGQHHGGREHAPASGTEQRNPASDGRADSGGDDEPPVCVDRPGRAHPEHRGADGSGHRSDQASAGRHVTPRIMSCGRSPRAPTVTTVSRSKRCAVGSARCSARTTVTGTSGGK